ncbi:PAS domain-containing protein [Steroidobacter agaridevorans]|uniref:PAS domain-containing protein n=1 Tax=Steroidobacter agaridevorans TaxID=2695856 RepID=UPI0013287441|nr:PAS domain-containing protein [Steroidobacter agaridevorans]GFE86098.1 hypothetical protein GCM10011488_10520 [Steroidobacter agaridevorans]
MHAKPGRVGLAGGHRYHSLDATRLVERKLRESQERLHAFLLASTTSMYRMSADWSEMRELDGQGFLSDTASPRTNWLQSYIPVDEQRRVLAAIAEAIRTKSMFDLEHRVQLADGSLGWTHSRAVPMLDERGEIVEWFGAATDITERKRMEDALRAGEERFRLLYEAQHTAHLVLSPDLIIEAVSEPYAQATLTRETDLVGKHMFDAFPDNPDDPQATGQTAPPDQSVIHQNDIRRRRDFANELGGGSRLSAKMEGRIPAAKSAGRGADIGGGTRTGDLPLIAANERSRCLHVCGSE